MSTPWMKPWPVLMSLALWPYYIILTVARFLPTSLGGMKVPTDLPDWKVFFILCFPLTMIQLYLGFFMAPLLLWDYEIYKRECGEKGKSLDRAPDNGIHHGVTTWLYTRYLEHPLFKPDLHYIDYHLMQSAYAPGAERYLPAALPYREARSRPKMMEGLPQRQLTQIPEESESERLNEVVFKRVFKGMDEVEVGASLLEGTGADALRWRTQNCRPELESIKREFAHQHTIDKSWHILLSPADAVEVINKGWGERGPPKIAQGMGPPGLVLVYGPRNYNEREVFMKILTASTSFCSEGAQEGGQ